MCFLEILIVHWWLTSQELKFDNCGLCKEFEEYLVKEQVFPPFQKFRCEPVFKRKLIVSR